MTTFLQLCQDTGRDSGTVASTAALGTVVGATGRQDKIVRSVIDAWNMIQRARTDWKWQIREFSGPTVIGQARYTAAQFNITRFKRWLTDTPDYRPHTVFDPALGTNSEQEIVEIDYSTWRTRYGRGTPQRNRPTEYAISPLDEFCLGAVPDKVYTVRGEYRLGPQTLAADADVPELPEEFHDIIRFQALMLLAGHDEAPFAVAETTQRYQVLFRSLVNDQTGSPVI